MKGNVQVMTDHPKYGKLEFSVVASVASDIVFVPSEIVIMGRKDRPEPVTIHAALRSRTGAPFNILSVVPPSPDMAVSYTPTEGGGYRLEIQNVMPNDDLNGQKLAITTDDDNARQVAIPFRVVLTAVP